MSEGFYEAVIVRSLARELVTDVTIALSLWAPSSRGGRKPPHG